MVITDLETQPVVCLFVCLVDCWFVLLRFVLFCFGWFVCLFVCLLRNYYNPYHPWVFQNGTHGSVTLEASDKNVSAKRTVNGAAREEGPAAGPSPGSSCFFSLKGVCLGGGNSNIFYFQPYVGKMSNLTNIFQMGWNHQLVLLGMFCEKRKRGSKMVSILFRSTLYMYTYIYIYVILCTWMKSPIYVYGAQIIRFWIGLESWIRL